MTTPTRVEYMIISVLQQQLGLLWSTTDDSITVLQEKKAHISQFIRVDLKKIHSGNRRSTFDRYLGMRSARSFSVDGLISDGLSIAQLPDKKTPS